MKDIFEFKIVIHENLLENLVEFNIKNLAKREVFVIKQDFLIPIFAL